MALFEHDYNASKNIFAFLWQFLFHPLIIMFCVYFSYTQLEVNNKSGKTKTAAFLDLGLSASKSIFLLFFDSFSFTLS